MCQKGYWPNVVLEGMLLMSYAKLFESCSVDQDAYYYTQAVFYEAMDYLLSRKSHGDPQESQDSPGTDNE